MPLDSSFLDAGQTQPNTINTLIANELQQHMNYLLDHTTTDPTSVTSSRSMKQ